MTSFVVCKLNCLIWFKVFLSYGISQINSSVTQAYNTREFSVQLLNMSSGQDRAIMEQRCCRRVLWAPELSIMQLLIFHSSKGCFWLSLLQLAIIDASLAFRTHKYPEKGVTPGAVNWPKHLRFRNRRILFIIAEKHSVE